MATVTFDTLKFVEKLRAAGVSEAHAKAEAEALVSVLAEAIEQQLATKEDIRGLREDFAGLRTSTREEIAGLRNSTKEEIAGLRNSTKEEIAGLRSSTREDISGLERTLKTDITALQRDMFVVKWMMGLVLGGVTALILKSFFPG